MVMLALIGSVGAILLTLVAGALRDAAPELRLLATVVFVTSWAPLPRQFARAPPPGGGVDVAAGLARRAGGDGASHACDGGIPQLSPGGAEAMTTASPPLAPLILIEPPPPSLRLYGERNLVVDERWSGRSSGIGRAINSPTSRFVPRASARWRAPRGAPIEILIRTPSLILARIHP